jgi:16S rRNA (guanine966-N2)-methyltransferase
MKLRIITGRLKGRSVTLDRAAAAFRPTLERHRESILQILSPWTCGAIAADVCAGSGVCGFELLSRGARHVDFVERDRGRADAIRQAVNRFGVGTECTVHTVDAGRFAAAAPGRYDIVYFDPPYEDQRLADALPVVLGMLRADGVLAYERSSRRAPYRVSGDALRLADTREYGTTAVDFYTRGRDADSTVSGNV